MAINLTYIVTVNYTPDGAGPFNNAVSAQFDLVNTAPSLAVAGGNNPSAAQLTAAFTAMAADINAQANAAVLARVQNFQNGGT